MIFVIFNDLAIFIKAYLSGFYVKIKLNFENIK